MNISDFFVVNQTDIQNESSGELILFMILPSQTPSFALGVVFATATSFIGTYYFWMIEGGQRQLSGHHKLTLTFCSFLMASASKQKMCAMLMW